MSILKLFVMFSSGLSSVCHFGHDGEIIEVTRDQGHAVVPAGRTGGGTASRVPFAYPVVLLRIYKTVAVLCHSYGLRPLCGFTILNGANVIEARVADEGDNRRGQRCRRRCLQGHEWRGSG